MPEPSNSLKGIETVAGKAPDLPGRMPEPSNSLKGIETTVESWVFYLLCRPEPSNSLKGIETSLRFRLCWYCLDAGTLKFPERD